MSVRAKGEASTVRLSDIEACGYYPTEPLTSLTYRLQERENGDVLPFLSSPHLSTMSSLTIPSTIIQAGNHFANMVKALRPSDPDKGTIIFFRVPNSLKTHKIDMPRQLKYVREAAFFIDKAIKSKEELFFLKCIVYQLSMFYPPAVPLTMETCMALFGVSDFIFVLHDERLTPPIRRSSWR